MNFRNDKQRKAMFAAINGVNSMNSFSAESGRFVKEDRIADMNKGTESVLDAYKGGYLGADDLDEAYSLGLVSDPVYESLSRRLNNFSNGDDFTSALDLRKKQLTKMYDEEALDLNALSDPDKKILMGVLEFRSEVNESFNEQALLGDIKNEIKHDRVRELAGDYEFSSENVELGRVAHNKILAQGLDAELTKDEKEAHFVYMQLLDELEKDKKSFSSREDRRQEAIEKGKAEFRAWLIENEVPEEDADTMATDNPSRDVGEFKTFYFDHADPGLEEVGYLGEKKKLLKKIDKTYKFSFDARVKGGHWYPADFNPPDNFPDIIRNTVADIMQSGEFTGVTGETYYDPSDEKHKNIMNGMVNQKLTENWNSSWGVKPSGRYIKADVEDALEDLL